MFLATLPAVGQLDTTVKVPDHNTVPTVAVGGTPIVASEGLAVMVIEPAAQLAKAGEHVSVLRASAMQAIRADCTANHSALPN